MLRAWRSLGVNAGLYDSLAPWWKSATPLRLREIKVGMGLNSLATVHKHVANLEEEDALSANTTAAAPLIAAAAGKLMESMAVNPAVVLPLVGGVAAASDRGGGAQWSISLAELRSKKCSCSKCAASRCGVDVDGDFVLVEKTKTAPTGTCSWPSK